MTVTVCDPHPLCLRGARDTPAGEAQLPPAAQKEAVLEFVTRVDKVPPHMSTGSMRHRLMRSPADSKRVEDAAGAPWPHSRPSAETQLQK